MDFRILGPIDVHGPAGAIALGGAKPRAVLAILLLHANEPVSAERIALALWGEDSPQRAVRAVAVHVSRLRKALGDPEILTTTAGGYRLRVLADELDVERFERLFEDGRRALASSKPEQAAATLRAALGLWRGPALSDVELEPFARLEAARLEELRMTAIEARVEVDLELGRHTQLVSELRRLVTSNPTRERLAGHLMLALYRSGRQSDALDVYHSTRRVLVEEAGLEPGPQLRRLQEAILDHDPALEPGRLAPELPPELDAAAAPRVAGRDAELHRLRRLWERARHGSGTLVVLSGGAGSGRSRLAAELASEVHREQARVLHCAGSDARGLIAQATALTSPALLVADDVDAAHDGSLPRLLGDLAHAVAGRPILAIAIVEAPVEPDGFETLALEPLDVAAVTAIAAAAAPAHPREDVPGAWLLDASGGVPQRVHELVRQWIRREAARRVGAVAERAATGRAELRAMEAELTGGVIELQAADELAPEHDDGAAVVCPFKGLATFQAGDAQYFCGRERLVAELVARLVGAPLLGIVGPSGSGKSSVVRAGLLPALAAGVLPGSDEWAQIVIRPGEHPLRELHDALAEVAPDTHLVLAVDQFEEAFTRCGDEGERARFIDELVQLALTKRSHRVVVLAIRADHYGRCAPYPQLASVLAPNHVLVQPMAGEELRLAIERPAARAGLVVDPALTDALLGDVEGEPGALPLLSSALLELWQDRDGRHLTHAAYERAGGVKGAVARVAERAFCGLDEARREVARGLLVRLAVIGESGTVERRRAPLDELRSVGGDQVGPTIELLADSRLLTVGAGTAEIAHEALLREWPRLRGWIDEDLAGMRIQRGLTTAAQEWLRLERDDGELYRGARLMAALEWRAARNPALTALEREFLDAGEQRRDRDVAANRRRVRRTFVAMAALVIASSVAAALAVSQGRQAARDRDAAASRALAGRSSSLLEADPGLSLGLGLESLRRADTEQARNAVREATYATRETGVWRDHASWVRGVIPSADGRRVTTYGQDGRVVTRDIATGHRVAAFRASAGYVLGAALSPEGESVATSATDGTVTVGNLDGSSRRVLLALGSHRFVNGLDISRDGRLLAAAVSDGTVRVLDLRRHAPQIVLRGHADYAMTARFGTSDRTLVSASLDRTVRIWDLASRMSRVLRDSGQVASASFSHDGRLVAAAGLDGRVVIWSSRSGRRLARFSADRGELATVRFSEDGRRLVTAGQEGVVRVWGVDGQLLGQLEGHRGEATSADFVASGDTVVSGGEDGTLRRWRPVDAAASRTPATVASFAGDGRRVVSGTTSGAVRIWDVASGVTTVLRGQHGASYPRFSADGSSVVSASLDGTVRVWRLGGSSYVAAAPARTMYAATFDPAGRRIAAAGFGSKITVQGLRGEGRVELAGHADSVLDVAFSPDGRRIVSASEDGTARIWSALGGPAQRVLRGHSEAVRAASFSPDGRRVVTAGSDGTVRVWPLAGGRPIVLYGHEGAVLSAQFNPRGDRIVSAGVDGTVRVWNAAGGETLVVLYRHRGPATAAWSPDGRRVVSAGGGLVRVSPCDVCGSLDDVLRLARQRADRQLSATERTRFLHDDG